MSRKASKNVSQGQSVIHGDAHNQTQWHSNRPTTTPIHMDPAIAKPDFELTSHADALSIPARPKTPTQPSKNDEAQNTRKQKQSTRYQSANFVTVDNNLSQLKSQNNILSRRDPIFGERQKCMSHVTYPVAARNFSPPPPSFANTWLGILCSNTMTMCPHIKRISGLDLVTKVVSKFPRHWSSQPDRGLGLTLLLLFTH
jgi:hypothetical protein